MGWIVSLITSLLGLFLKHKQDVSEQAGENIQALKDEGAANAVENAAVDAVVAADARRLQSDTTVDTDPNSPVNKQPGLELGN